MLTNISHLWLIAAIRRYGHPRVTKTLMLVSTSILEIQASRLKNRLMLASAIGCRGTDLPVQDPWSSFPRRTLRIQSRRYHTVYDDRRRIYVPGTRPPEVPKPRIRRSRLKIRAANNPVRNVIKVARKYEVFLARPEVYGYRQVAQNFGISKVMVSYYLTLLNRLDRVRMAKRQPDRFVFNQRMVLLSTSSPTFSGRM